MRIVTMFASLAFASLTMACATAPVTPSPSIPVAASEAVFRYVFDNNISGLKAQASSYCIGIGDRPGLADPSTALLQSLSDVQPPVRPASQCEAGAQVADAAGEPSLIFNLQPIDCRADECTVRAGYYEANLSASISQYTVRREGGRWTIDESQTAPGPVA